jgi:hypothetical protein
MYHFIKKIEDVLIYQFHDDNLMLISGKPNEAHLTIFNNDLLLTDKLEQVTAYDFMEFNNNVYITEPKSYNSYLLKFKDNKLTIAEKLNYTFNIKRWNFENLTIKNLHFTTGYIDKVSYYVLINLETGKILKKKSSDLGFGVSIFLISDDLIISANGVSFGLFTLDNQKIWEHNINNILISDKKGTIREMKIYNGNVIIVSELGYISIEIATGKINWATKGYADVIEIVGNIGYVCTNHSLSKINLDNGIHSGYGWEYNGFPDFEYNGENYGAVGYGVVHHEGLLWYAVYSSGQSFIIAINPHDGYYEWILHIEKAHKIDKLKFHKNRMYVRDAENNLFIYEKNIE